MFLSPPPGELGTLQKEKREINLFDFSAPRSLSEVPWYYSLTGNLRLAQTWWDLATLWRMTSWGRGLTGKAVWWFEKFGIVPKGTWDVQETLKIAADALVVRSVLSLALDFPLDELPFELGFVLSRLTL